MGVYSKEDIIRIVREEEIEFVRLQFTDIFGMLKKRGHHRVPRLKRRSATSVCSTAPPIEGFVRIDESDQYLIRIWKSFRIFPGGPATVKWPG